MVALMGIVCTMCTTDEGVSPSDDTAISGRGLISGTGRQNLIGLSTVNVGFMTVPMAQSKPALSLLRV